MVSGNHASSNRPPGYKRNWFKYLDFFLIKELQPMQRNYFIESIQESFGLLFNSSIKPPLGHKANDNQ